MLTEKTTVRTEDLRTEFSKMQRAQFIEWLINNDTEAWKEIAASERAIADGQAVDWKSVREEMNKKFNL